VQLAAARKNTAELETNSVSPYISCCPPVEKTAQTPISSVACFVGFRRGSVAGGCGPSRVGCASCAPCRRRRYRPRPQVSERGLTSLWGASRAPRGEFCVFPRGTQGKGVGNIVFLAAKCCGLGPCRTARWVVRQPLAAVRRRSALCHPAAARCKCAAPDVGGCGRLVRLWCVGQKIIERERMCQCDLGHGLCSCRWPNVDPHTSTDRCKQPLADKKWVALCHRAYAKWRRAAPAVGRRWWWWWWWLGAMSTERCVSATTLGLRSWQHALNAAAGQRTPPRPHRAMQPCICCRVPVAGGCGWVCACARCSGCSLERCALPVCTSFQHHC
jgi:hypothetical protein